MVEKKFYFWMRGVFCYKGVVGGFGLSRIGKCLWFIGGGWVWSLGFVWVLN